MELAVGPLPLFVYGTLRDRAAREHVIGPDHDHAIEPARLPGFRRRSLSRVPYPFVEPAEPDNFVRGLLIRGLTNVDYERLDEYADVASGRYERATVRVKTARGEVVAYVYAMPSSAIC